MDTLQDFIKAHGGSKKLQDRTVAIGADKFSLYFNEVTHTLVFNNPGGLGPNLVVPLELEAFICIPKLKLEPVETPFYMFAVTVQARPVFITQKYYENETEVRKDLSPKFPAGAIIAVDRLESTKTLKLK